MVINSMSSYQYQTGFRNLITDVEGLRVGEAHDKKIVSGVTVLLFEEPAVGSVAFLGGGPANRDTACLEPDTAISHVDAFVLSGGSGFGLDAATGVQSWLKEQGRGLAVGNIKIPIVPQAILFDLLNGGNKDWGRFPPYRDLAYEAAGQCKKDFLLGTYGAGYGASTIHVKGGLGSASIITPSGFTLGALVAVNSLSSPILGNSHYFWAAPYEIKKEFGGFGLPKNQLLFQEPVTWKGQIPPATFSTTLAILATDAALDKAKLKRLAFAAQGGMSKALRLAHGFMDGDIIFSASTGKKILTDIPNQMTELGAYASDCIARAIARGIYEATSLPFPELPPSWKDKYKKELERRDCQ